MSKKIEDVNPEPTATVEELEAVIVRLQGDIADKDKRIAELEAEGEKEQAKKREFGGGDEVYEILQPSVKVIEKGLVRTYSADELLATTGKGKSKEYVNAHILERLVASKSTVIRKKGGK